MSTAANFTRTMPIGLADPEFGVRADADKLQGLWIWLAINQHEIWLDMAVSMVTPIAR